MRSRLSLQGNLLLTFLGSVALAVGVTALAVVGLLAWLLAGDDRAMLSALRSLPSVQARAEAVGQVLASGSASPGAVRAAALRPDLPPDARVLVVGLDGQVWLDTAGEAGGTVPAAEVLTWILAGQEAGLRGVLTQAIRVDGRLWGYYVYKPPGWNQPVPGRSDRSVQTLTGWVMLLSEGFVLLVSLLLFWNFGRRLVGPIRRLSAVVGRIANGDLTARAGLTPRPDELGQLAHHVDSMAERLHEARQRAAAAEENRRYTLAAISHDLRTPLTALLAHAEAVRTGVTDDAGRSLAVIQEKGLLMKGLIDDLFELAALDADHSPWESRRVDVAELVREAVVGLLPQLEAAGLTVDPEIPEEPVLADLPSGKLERVLDNLLTNALKYGAAGGWLGIRLRPGQGLIRIEVADRGPGIPPGEERRIFDPFYRADAARAGSLRGSGLGLAVAGRIVERLGGRIGVESPAEGGACFWVELPATERKARVL